MEGQITASASNLPAVSIRCPHCRHVASFAVASQHGVSYHKKTLANQVTTFIATIRSCPNQECRGLTFVIEQNGRAIEVEPPQLLDFALENLPALCQAMS